MIQTSKVLAQNGECVNFIGKAESKVDQREDQIMNWQASMLDTDISPEEVSEKVSYGPNNIESVEMIIQCINSRCQNSYVVRISCMIEDIGQNREVG